MQISKILTQEDWNAVLYNGMAATSPLAALYFVALMTFGNYVLFNLLVAILVEGFQAEVRGTGQPKLTAATFQTAQCKLVNLLIVTHLKLLIQFCVHQ